VTLASGHRNLQAKYRVGRAELLFSERSIKTPSLKQFREYRQAKLILVTIANRTSGVIDPQLLFEEDYSFQALEDDPDFHVTPDSLKEFVPLVKKFL
jgi:hypothetical protein